MNDGSDSVRISLRLADGDYFPIFQQGDPKRKQLLVIPATAGQSEADIHFFHHAGKDAEPQKLGNLRFSNLPPDENVELNMVATVKSAGLLSVTLTHAESNRSESAEFAVPDEHISAAEEGSTGVRPWRAVRWLLGILFVIVALALILLATYAFAEWGRQEPEPPPLSLAQPRFAVDMT